MGLTTIQEFVVDTLIEKQSITKEKLSNALDQILSSEGIDKFLGLLIQEKPVDKKLNKWKYWNNLYDDFYEHTKQNKQESSSNDNHYWMYILWLYFI